MKKIGFLLAMTLAVLTGTSNAQLVISQYFEGPSGTGNSKAIELWNVSGSTIDFSVLNLLVNAYANGASTPSTFVPFNITSGTIAAGAVIVLAHNDAAFNTSLSNAGITVFATSSNLTFNGDDAFSISLGGTVVDVFGTIGSDPGTAWTGGGVTTVDTNIALAPGITTGTTTGFSDPSTRFTTVVTPTNPLDGTDLQGLGVAPEAIPEPSTYAMLLAGAGLVIWTLRRKRQNA